MEQRSKEWFEARRAKITASAVGGILGNSPYQKRADVLRRMVREYHRAESEFSGNIATEYGTRNEDGALVEFEMETGLTVQAVGFITREDWAGCSPDGLLSDYAGLEIKCPFGKRKDKKPAFKTLREQPHYYDQVQFSLWATDRMAWLFYQWAPGGAVLETVSVDRAWQDENLPKLRQFYAEYLDAVKVPDDYLEPLRAEVDTFEAQRIVSEYDQLSEAIDNATSRKKKLLAEMVRLAGDRDAIFGGRKLTLVKRVGSVSYAKAIAKYAPGADLEPFRGTASSSWRLS